MTFKEFCNAYNNSPRIPIMHIGEIAYIHADRVEIGYGNSLVFYRDEKHIASVYEKEKDVWFLGGGKVIKMPEWRNENEL